MSLTCLLGQYKLFVFVSFGLQDTPVGVDTTVPAPSSSHIMMSPEQPALPQTPLSPDPLVPQRTSLDLEQAWMELLSLPELQV